MYLFKTIHIYHHYYYYSQLLFLFSSITITITSTTTGGTNLHYWLVTAKTNPETAPTVIWFNGGPGCSSLDGFVYEHGPFVVAKDLTLSERAYSWNTKANVLYIEAPVGVGFSYSDSKNYKCDDDRTATENRAAVEKFFSLYPEYKSNKFFITGESYAGKRFLYVYLSFLLDHLHFI